MRLVILRGKDGAPGHVLVTFHPLVMTRARLDSLFETVLYELRPHRVKLGQVSPRSLVEWIRAPVSRTFVSETS